MSTVGYVPEGEKLRARLSQSLTTRPLSAIRLAIWLALFVGVPSVALGDGLGPPPPGFASGQGAAIPLLVYWVFAGLTALVGWVGLRWLARRIAAQEHSAEDVAGRPSDVPSSSA